MTKEKMKLWHKHKIIIHSKFTWYNSLLKTSHDSQYTLMHFCHACTNVSICMYICNAPAPECAAACLCGYGCAYAHSYVHACEWVYVGVREWYCVHNCPWMSMPVCKSSVDNYLGVCVCNRSAPSSAIRGAPLDVHVCLCLCAHVRSRVGRGVCMCVMLECALVCDGRLCDGVWY